LPFQKGKSSFGKEGFIPKALIYKEMFGNFGIK